MHFVAWSDSLVLSRFSPSAPTVPLLVFPVVGIPFRAPCAPNTVCRSPPISPLVSSGFVSATDHTCRSSSFNRSILFSSILRSLSFSSSNTSFSSFIQSVFLLNPSSILRFSSSTVLRACLCFFLFFVSSKGQK